MTAPIKSGPWPNRTLFVRAATVLRSKSPSWVAIFNPPPPTFLGETCAPPRTGVRWYESGAWYRDWSLAV